jgi:hypothetical protein
MGKIIGGAKSRVAHLHGTLPQKLEADPAQPKHLLTETAAGYRLWVA